MNTPTIRIATIPDIEEIIILRYKLDSESAHLPYTAHDISIDYNLYAKLNVDIFYVLLEDNDKLIGFCSSTSYTDDGTQSGCLVIGVLQEYTNQGYGKLLLDRIISITTFNGYNRLFLYVSILNVVAISLYLKCNFKIVYTGYIEDGTENIYGRMHLLEYIP